MFDERTPRPKHSEGGTEAVQESYYAYLEEISQYKLLSIDEEVSLFQRIQAGDNVAKELFVKSNLRLVVKQAKKFYRPGYNQLLDLIQDGNIGLLKAIEMYDPQRGTKFSTYAVYHINKAIQQSVLRSGAPVFLPAQKAALAYKIKTSIEFLEAEKGAKPSLSELADYHNISVAQIRELLPHIAPSFSLNAKVKEDVDEREFLDVFTEHYASEDSPVENAHIIRETRDEFRNILQNVLSKKDAYILFSRWGLFNTPTKDVSLLADELGMSKQGIRQSELRSIAKIKRFLISSNMSFEDFI